MSRFNSLVGRIAVGKFVGLIFGIAGFILVTALVPDVTWSLPWGVLLWYVTLGAVIGVFGVFTRHPVLQIPMPWWVRAPFIGGWMNFVLVLFAYDSLKHVAIAVFGSGSTFVSPFWFVAEGAIVGAIIGYCATKLGGEGANAVDA